MTAPRKDGGPAFPCEDHYNPRGEFHQTGMSLRDWFAGQAMQGLWVAFNRDWSNPNDYQINAIAANAYNVADAMLAAREKPE